MMSQSNQQHMMMPAKPAAHLVVVETNFSFGFFENGFDRPTHSAEAYKLDQGGLDGSVAKVELDFAGIIQVAADDQPNFRARQISPHFNDPQEGKVTHDRAFRTFFDGGRAPTFFRDRSDQVFDADRVIRWITQTQASWVTTAAFPLRHMYFRSAKPNQGRAFDFSEVPFIQFSHTISKSGRIAIQFIRCHPSKGQTASLDSSSQQFQPDFGLGLPCQLFWHTTGYSFCSMLFIKPGFRHEQLSFNQAVALTTGIAQIHSHLAVGHFPNRTTVLCRYSNRIIP